MSFTCAAGHTVENGFHQPGHLAVDPFQFIPIGVETGIVFSHQAVDVAGIVIAERLNQRRFHQVFLKTLQNQRFQFIAAQGHQIAACALVPRVEAANALGIDMDHAAAAHPAGHQP